MISNTDYQKIESIHVALQEVQNKYLIPQHDEDINTAFELLEDLRELYFKGYTK